MMSSPESEYISMALTPFQRVLPCVRTAPFGLPVVPDVYMMK